MMGAAAIGAGASIWGSSQAAKSQKNAAQQAAAQQAAAMAYQKQIYGDAQGNLNPFIQSGQGANNLLSSMYGLNGDKALGDNALQRFYQSPDFQFALKGGGQALDNSAAARGGVLGGNQIRAQTDYGQGMATQNLGNYLGRLTGMSNQGQNAALGLGSIGNGSGANVGNSANNIGNSLMAAGQADASGYIGMANGINNGLNNWATYSNLNKSSFGGGGYNGYGQANPWSQYGQQFLPR